MKTKSINLIIGLLLTLAMMFGMVATTSHTLYARAYPDPTKIPAETIYVGGIELGLGQYVKNGETTTTTGEPSEDATGYAWYTEDGTLVLVDYTYTGKGYEYSSGNFALIYSTGALYVAGSGSNTLKQTQSHNMGIYSVGALAIAPMGTLTIEGDNCSCLYSNNEITFTRYLGKVYLKSTGNATAIVSYDNDGDSLDEQGIIVKGGDIYVETFYPISDVTINYGALTVSSPQYPLSEVPDISNYDGGYTLTVSENEDGSNSKTYNQDTITTFDIDKITDYKYLRLAPPAKTVINSVSVSDIDLPEIGEFFEYPDETALTYGGEYIVSGCWIEKYTGTEWIYLEDAEVIEHSVKYRCVPTLRPNAGYTFSEDITDDNVTINGKEGVVLDIFPDDAFTNQIEVALEFSYEAPATNYDITIADKEGNSTVGVDITSANCEDVLGDGTVSYNPTTNTLTLNNYVYEGEGLKVDEGGYIGIMSDIPTEGLTIVLVGTNSITVSGSDSAGMIFFGEGDLTIKGSGSLSINTVMYGITLQSDSGNLAIENATINITTTNAMAIGIQATEFVMTSGDLKITASMIGVGTSNEDGICVNGGSMEISSALGGYAFIYIDFEHMTFNPVKPDLSNYVGDYTMTAGVNTNGSDASAFNEGYLSSYKYISVKEIVNYGIIVAQNEGNSIEGIGVLITAENYEDVLGDGTVSYDPETHTLTLNGYNYSGEGFYYDDLFYGILIDSKIENITIVLVGENSISLTEKEYNISRAIDLWEIDTIIKGSGSLTINSLDGIMAYGEACGNIEIQSGNITITGEYGIGSNKIVISGGNITINALGGGYGCGMDANEFAMSGGNLKITSDSVGVYMWYEDSPVSITDGTLEISVKKAGLAFGYYDSDEDDMFPYVYDFSDYTAQHTIIASANQDGSNTVDYNVDNAATYKYVKLEPVHVHDYDSDWKNDANEHWNECECGDKSNKASHLDENADGKCDVCEWQMTNSNSKQGLSGGAIAGIVIASVVVTGLGGFAVVWFVIKKKSFADLVAIFKKK